MGAMASEGERREGGVINDAFTQRIFYSSLGKRASCERSSSPSGSPSTPPMEEASLRKLREVHVRAMKRKVGQQQYVDHSGSESESVDELDSEHSLDSESSEEKTSDDGDVSESAGESKKQLKKKCVCEECGIRVKKPALLIQHMRSHSDQKPFACPERGCGCAYKREDHLNRHLKTHQGVLYFCPQPGCFQKFTLNSNLQRHLKNHDEKRYLKCSGENMNVCSVPNCGTAFKYPSLLRAHEIRVHEKVEYAECICIYPGCGDKLSSEKALVEHAETCHPYLLCEVCGETIRRKSFLRHARTHGTKVPREVVCPHDGCGKTYTRPFICSHEGCNKVYAHKAARDRHERAGVHSLPMVDFQDQDEFHLSRPRGGRNPIAFDKVETYLRKRRVDDPPIL